VIGRDVISTGAASRPTRKWNCRLADRRRAGKYTGPASRAYLYYTDEFKTWVDGVSVDISAK